MLNFVKNFLDLNQRRINSYRPIIKKINELEPVISQLSDEKLAAKTPYFKKLLADGKSLDDILPEAYAVVREAIKRTIGERAYDV